jgi:hypothetical protein
MTSFTNKARIETGIPLGMLQTIPIVYAQEVAPAVLRPYLTTYVNMCWVREATNSPTTNSVP